MVNGQFFFPSAIDEGFWTISLEGLYTLLGGVRPGAQQSFILGMVLFSTLEVMAGAGTWEWESSGYFLIVGYRPYKTADLDGTFGKGQVLCCARGRLCLSRGKILVWGTTRSVGNGPSNMHFPYPQYDIAGHSLLVSVCSFPYSTIWTSPFAHIISWSVDQIWNYVLICFFFVCFVFFSTADVQCCLTA